MSGGKPGITPGPGLANIKAESFSPLFSMALALGHRQSPIQPIRAEIGGDVHDFHVGETHGMQRLIGGTVIVAGFPATASPRRRGELVVAAATHSRSQHS